MYSTQNRGYGFATDLAAREIEPARAHQPITELDLLFPPNRRPCYSTVVQRNLHVHYDFPVYFTHGLANAKAHKVRDLFKHTYIDKRRYKM